MVELRSANDRLKSSSTDVLALSLIAATGLHLLVFQIWPEMTVEDWAAEVAEEVEVIQLDEIFLPAAPDLLTRPAAPVIATDAPVDATIVPVDFREARELPPPPPPEARSNAGERVPFVVFEVLPRLTNPDELHRALMRAYPAALRDAGIGGTVRLQVHVDEAGRANDARVASGSGYEALDRAALDLIDVMRFSPALNRDRPVTVWIELPIDFRVRD